MKPYIKYILGMVALALFCLTSSSCSDDKENDVEVLQGDYSAKVEISYTATGNDSVLNPVVITVFGNDGQSTTETVNLNTQWTKTVTYSTLPATVGFVAETAPVDGVSSGTEISAGFKGSCTVTLLCGDKVADFQTIEIDDDFSFEKPDEVCIITDDYVFNVTEEGIVRYTFDEDSSNVDDTQETDDLPEEDQDKVKASGNLYYISSVNAAEDEDSLHDNIVVRFASQNPWAGTELTYGDFLLLRGSEMDAVDETVLKTSLDNGCILILEEVDNFEALVSFCEKYAIYCPLTEAPSDLAYCLFVLADANAEIDLDIDPDENVRSLFFMISPTDGEDGYLTDYSQGLVIDHAVTVLNDLFESSESKAASTRAVEKEDLTKFAEVYKVLLSHSQTLDKSNYRAGTAASDSQMNIYSLEYDIYNVYSFYESLNYYYIHQEFTCNFEPCYKSMYLTRIHGDGADKKKTYSVLEWYGAEVALSTKPNGTDDMWIHRYSPETTTGSSSYTSGLEWSLSGEVGYSNGQAKVIDVVYVSEETSYSMDNMDVYSYSTQGAEIAWSFQFASATGKTALSNSGTNLQLASSTSASTYTGGTDCIISFPEEDTAPVLTGTFTVTLRSTSGTCGSVSHYLDRTLSASKTVDIQLPMLYESDFDDV